jgi:hypothetical protein
MNPDGDEIMRIFRSTFLLTLTLLFTLMLASAEDKFGVKVYDGAKFDADTTAFVEHMGGQAACYRSADDLSKVIAFYSKLPGVAVIHTSAKGAMFKLNGVTITLQSPWMNQKTGTRNTDTLISIVKS